MFKRQQADLMAQMQFEARVTNSGIASAARTTANAMTRNWRRMEVQ
jgi:hypothetical protein